MKKKAPKQKISNQLPFDESGNGKGDLVPDVKKDEEYLLATEPELNTVSLVYSENSFKDDWNLEDAEENHYWNSFQKGIEKMVEESDPFQFLNDEPDIYTKADIKKKY